MKYNPALAKAIQAKHNLADSTVARWASTGQIPNGYNADYVSQFRIQGYTLREAREALGVSQIDLSEKLREAAKTIMPAGAQPQIWPQQISHWEKGSFMPSKLNMLIIEQFFANEFKNKNIEPKTDADAALVG